MPRSGRDPKPKVWFVAVLAMLGGCSQPAAPPAPPAASSPPTVDAEPAGPSGQGPAKAPDANPNNTAASGSAKQDQPSSAVRPEGIAPSQIPSELPNVSAKALSRMDHAHRRMVTKLREIAITSADKTPYIGDYDARRMRWMADSLKANPQTARTAFALFDNLAQAELVLGNEEAAIQSYASAEELLPQIRGEVHPSSVDRFLFRIGGGASSTR